MKLSIIVVFAVLIACVAARRHCDARRGLTLSRPGRCCEWTCPRHMGAKPIQACVNTSRRMCICNPSTHCRNLKTNSCRRLIRRG